MLFNWKRITRKSLRFYFNGKKQIVYTEKLAGNVNFNVHFTLYNEHDEKADCGCTLTQWRLCGDFAAAVAVVTIVVTKLQLPLFFPMIIIYELVLDLKPPVKSRQITNKRRKNHNQQQRTWRKIRRQTEEKIGGVDGHNYAITRFCRCKLWLLPRLLLLCEPGELEQNRSFNFTWNDFITHKHTHARTNIFVDGFFCYLIFWSFAKVKPGQCF